MEFVKGVVRAVQRMCKRSGSMCDECPMAAHMGGCMLAMAAKEGDLEKVEKIMVKCLERMKGARE